MHHRHSHSSHCERVAYHHPPFGRGRHGMKSPFGPGSHAEAFAAFVGHHGRARRGDIRTAILRLVAEQPMHGYQIIQELPARTDGAWKPSAGSIYPTLQMLADEGLIVADDSSGKKVFSLTEAGQAAVAEMADQPAPWESAGGGASDASGAYREAATRLAQVMWQVGTSGSAEQIAAATEILVETRKRLYSVLAED